MTGPSPNANKSANNSLPSSAGLQTGAPNAKQKCGCPGSRAVRDPGKHQGTNRSETRLDKRIDPSPVGTARPLVRLFITMATSVVILWIMLSPLSTRAAADAPADPIRGKQLFEKRCTGCHSLDADKEGPRLRGVYGRKAGTAPGFNYSDALKSANFTWNDALLDKWLTDTDAVVPDNNMDFHVPNPDERADIIRYLKVSSGN